MYSSVLYINKKLRSSSKGMDSGKAVKAKTKRTSKIQLSGGTGTIKLDCVTHVPKVSLKLVLVAGLCDDGHIVRFTKKSTVI